MALLFKLSIPNTCVLLFLYLTTAGALPLQDGRSRSQAPFKWCRPSQPETAILKIEQWRQSLMGFSNWMTKVKFWHLTMPQISSARWPDQPSKLSQSSNQLADSSSEAIKTNLNGLSVMTTTTTTMMTPSIKKITSRAKKWPLTCWT